MIKDRLMKALKIAVGFYNGGEGADASVAKAADEFDFNEAQTERLVEMFNTAATLNKEKDESDPTGSCELADKKKVCSLLLNSDCSEKKASCDVDVPFAAYDFYQSTPKKTNSTIDAINRGAGEMCKAASSEEEDDALSRMSGKYICKLLFDKIDIVKRAAASADDAARCIKFEIDRKIDKIASEIDGVGVDRDLVDMFKVACAHDDVVKAVSSVSRRLANSDGGRFAKVAVFDSSKIDGALKLADDIKDLMSKIPECEKARDFYLAKSAEARDKAMECLGYSSRSCNTLADMFTPSNITQKKAEAEPAAPKVDTSADMSVKLASILMESCSDHKEVVKIAEMLEKEAAKASDMVGIPSVSDMHDALVGGNGLPYEDEAVLNMRRSVILADLMSNDPIIRDADPAVVTEAYKTMVMTAPRVSLDKAQARAFLRTAANSVAISPNDAKVLADVDYGVSRSNSLDALGRLSMIDSSIKDSNRV